MQLISWKDQNWLRLCGKSILYLILVTNVHAATSMCVLLCVFYNARVQTSYVTVEPKRKKRVTPPVEGGSGTDQPQPSDSAVAHGPSSAVAYPQAQQQYTQEGRPPSRQRREGKRGERELKRARIVITVRRTAAYKQWLDDNPLQAVIAGDGDDENRPTDTQAEPSDVESKSS